MMSGLKVLPPLLRRAVNALVRVRDVEEEVLFVVLLQVAENNRFLCH